MNIKPGDIVNIIKKDYEDKRFYAISMHAPLYAIDEKYQLLKRNNFKLKICELKKDGKRFSTSDGYIWKTNIISGMATDFRFLSK